MGTVLYCGSRKRETVLNTFTLFTIEGRAVVDANRLKQPAVAVDDRRERPIWTSADEVSRMTS